MSLQNRVDPTGHLVATPSRGTIMGNRGKLHDGDRRVVRSRSGRANWVCCRLEFRGRHRTVMHPRSYTELFFLDEVTALAAGHRPCAECRHPAYQHFKRCWATAHGYDELPSAVEMDAVLAPSRRTEDGTQRTHLAPLDDLPDGTVVGGDTGFRVIRGDRACRWTFDGYRDAVARSALPSQVVVRTPEAVVAVLRAGFRPGFHPSFDTASALDPASALESASAEPRSDGHRSPVLDRDVGDDGARLPNVPAGVGDDGLA